MTGEREDLADDLADRVAAIRQRTKLPLVVGFGISLARQVREVAQVADGVVVGSALVNCIPQNLHKPDAMIQALREKTKIIGQWLECSLKS